MTYLQENKSSSEIERFWSELIKEREAAQFLGLSVRTLQAYRWRGGGPQFIQLSKRCIRYRRSDLTAWADNKLRDNTVGLSR